MVDVLAGFLVGLVMGLTGVGGGALMTPILVLLFGLSPASAVGTDLWFAAITKIVGGTIHGQRGGVDWQVVRRLWWGSLPAALGTLTWLHTTGQQGPVDTTIKVVLGAVLLATAAAMAFKPQLHAWGSRLRVQEPGRFKRWQPAATGILASYAPASTTIPVTPLPENSTARKPCKCLPLT